MKNHVCGCSGRQTNADSSSIVMPNDQNHGDGFPHNVSVQTGEEFSPEFLRERIESRRIPSMNDVDQIPSKPGFEVIRNPHHHVYDDPTGNIGMRRVDSESCTELTDFSPGKGYGFDIGYETYKDGSNRYYRELQASAQLQTKFSGDLHINSPSCQPVYSLDAGNFYQVYNKAPGMLDSSFSGKVKFLCSVGGKILPRPNDGKLRYVGGETRIISIRKNITYLELVKKASAICKYPFTIKYQLPGEDLDSLISVSSDEDLHHMIEEYHELERSSQRLRLFLVRNGDLEGTLEVRATQQNHPEYQYVSAINGMLEPSTKSSSRESSESQGESNYDVCPTVQKGCPTSFHHLETQNGRSNLNFMLSSPCAHVLHSPQVPSNSHALSPSISPVQVKDSNISTAEDYDGVASSYRQKINSPYIIATRTYESPPCVDASSVSHSHPNDSVPVILGMNPNSQVLQSYAAPTVNSRFLHLSKDFESHSPSGPGYYDSARGFAAATPLNSENFIPSQNAVGFSPMDDMHAKSQRTISNLFYESQPAIEEKPVPSLEQGYNISKDTVEHSQETQNLNKNYKWDKDMANGMKNMPRSDEIVKTYDINNGYTSNTHFLEHEHNLPRIICQPDPKFSSQVPTLKLQVNGTMNAPLMYNPAENAKENGEELPKEYQISPNEPAFFIKSQKGSLDNDQSQLASPVLVPTNEPNSGLDLRCLLVTTEAVLGQRKMMNGSYERTVKRSHGSVNKDKHDGNSHGESSIKRGTCVDSQPLNNCHETQPTERPSAVENVEDRQPTDGLSSPNTVPNIQIEHNDRIESPAAEIEAETVISESDCNDSNRIDGDKIDESLSDEAITEMEASIYGLQIIRNADLEDLHELGSGTYGTVYHGKWRGTDVAIKRIKKSCFPGKTSEQEQMTKDFWSEAKILSTLHHPNVVAFYGVVPDGPHIPLATVTEYMANGSLRRVLQRKDRALDQRKKVMIALDAAFGMEYLHLKNVVHFDLKCDNLLVNLGDPHRPVCKVGDFGLSRIKQNTLVSGGVRGTLPWMAPELLNGTSSLVCEKVDVFSFGISMWEILTGEEPYSNMHCGAIIGGIVNDTLRPPIPEHSDPEWKKLMEECWSHDPAARPSFTEITNRLRTMSQALQPKRFNRVKR